MVEKGQIESLKERRERALLRFALKAAESPRFGPAWFQENPVTSREVRSTTRCHFLERRPRTERDKSNPISVMTKLLNEQYRT